MLDLNNPTGANPQPDETDPLKATTGQSAPSIDSEFSGTVDGPGKLSNGKTTVNIKGQVKSGRSLSKNGKKIIVVACVTIPALVIVGVMLAGVHPGKGTADNTPQLAGAGDAPHVPAHPTRPPSLSSAVAATLSTKAGAHPSSTLTTRAAQGLTPKKAPLTPVQKYHLWLTTQHYKDLEGQYLAGQSALVNTSAWQSGGGSSTGGSAGAQATAGQGGSSGTEAVDALKKKLAAMGLQGATGVNGGAGSTRNGAKANTNFASAQDKKASGYLNARLHRPRSRSELFGGSVIPAVMVTGINSQLPGEITAQVRQNVYNSLNPGEVVIPQGSKLIGVYDSGVQYGQNRVLVAWSRVIYPNGETVDLEGMSGTDGLGRAGFSEITDNHYFRIFGSAFLISIIGAGAQLAQPQQSSSFTNPSAGQTATGAVAQEMDSVGASILQKNLSLAPTIKIHPGYLFNVMVSKTMILPVYHSREGGIG